MKTQETIDPYPHIVKTPHYFEVHFDERYTNVDPQGLSSDNYYTKFCDGIAVHVYGFKSQQEADAFDPLELRRYLRGWRTKMFLYAAENEQELLAKINQDEDIRNGSMRLAETTLYGNIQNLPTCERMHTNPHNHYIMCGKPIDSEGTGCLGGCVIQGYDQEFDPEFLVCPLQKFWQERAEKIRFEKAA